MDLNQVTAPCDDLDASIAFYRLLGLRLIVHSPPDYARFECPVGSATFSLHRVPHVSDGSLVVYFEIDDLDARVQQLTAAGVRFESEPKDQPWLWREAYVRDPAGNRPCLFRAGKNRHNPPWRLACVRFGRSALGAVGPRRSRGCTTRSCSSASSRLRGG